MSAGLSLNLQRQLDGKIGERGIRELTSLSRETDPELFFEALYHFGVRLEQRGEVAAAASVYSTLSAARALTPAPLPEGEGEFSQPFFYESPSPSGRGNKGEGPDAALTIPSNIQHQAAERLAALRGEGAVGLRLEVLGRTFARQAMAPAPLLGMGVAGLAFRGMNLFAATRLANLSAGFLTRGPGLRILSGLAGFAAEVPAFTLTGRVMDRLLMGNVGAGLRPARGPALGGPLLEELASAALVLGSLKVFGAAFGYAGKRIGETANRGIGVGLQQAGMLTGIMAGHGLEVAFGLREKQSPSLFLAESLVTLAQFNVAGRLSNSVFGERYERLQRSLAMQTEAIGRVRGSEFGVRSRIQRIIEQMRDRLNGPPLAGATVGGGRIGEEFYSDTSAHRHSSTLHDGNSFMVGRGEGGGLSLEPRVGESAEQWAQRLLELSRSDKVFSSLTVAQTLEQALQKPHLHPFVRQTVQHLVKLTSGLPEGEGVLVRNYSLPGLKDPLTILSLPTTFLPENWSQAFAKGVIQEFRRSGRPVERAIEIGAGTGWMSILMAKVGMAHEILGVDLNPHAQIIGRINAALNGVRGVQFLQSDLLSNIPGEKKADLIVACIPQVPSEAPLDLRDGADYYRSQGEYWDRYGLGLVDRALGQAVEFLKEEGRVLFNLGGRPGRHILEEMLSRRGLRPTVRYAELIPQDTRTDFSALARREEETGHTFEFFLHDPSRPISAAEAVGKDGVQHLLYLMEGRPFRSFLPEAADEVLRSKRPWPYTSEAGSEHEGLRETLAEELSRQWGVALSPELLFVGPQYRAVVEGWLRILVPPSGRVLWVGPLNKAREAISPLLQGMTHQAMATDLAAATSELETHPPSAAVLRLNRQAWDRPNELIQFLANAAEKKIHVLLLEAHPPRHREGGNFTTQFLARHPEVLEFTTLLQPLDLTYKFPYLPLSVGIVANPTLHLLLSRYGEVTYSRVSTPVQEIYHKFLQALRVGELQSPKPERSLSPLSVAWERNTPLVQALEMPAVFHAGPSGGHPDPIDMSFGESEWVPSVEIREAMLSALSSKESRRAIRQTQEEVSRYLSETRGLTYPPEQIVLGAGVHPLLVSAMRAIRQVPYGRELQVYVPKPSYGLYYPTVGAAGAHLVEVPTLFRNRFLLEGEALKRAVELSTLSSDPQRALLLNSPTNPAGQFYSEGQIRQLSEAVAHNRAFLMWDDVFGLLDFRTRGPHAHSELRIAREILKDRWVVFGGISKEAAMGGIRFGFAATENPHLARAMRAQILVPPDPIAMAAARAVLPRWQEIIYHHQNFLLHQMMPLAEFFRERNLAFHDVQGGYSLFVDLSPLYDRRLNFGRGRVEVITPENLHELLYSQAGIKVHSDKWAGVGGHYRFVFSIQRIEEAVQRLRKFFRNLR